MRMPGTPGLRVLVAEDEALAALVIEDALSELGHDVILAEDGEKALELLEHVLPDVVVTDLAMPRMTGWELIPRLREMRPDLPIVVMTGYLPPGRSDALFTGGRAPLALLMKPFDVSQLIAAVSQVMPGPLPCLNRAASRTA